MTLFTPPFHSPRAHTHTHTSARTHARMSASPRIIVWVTNEYGSSATDGDIALVTELFAGDNVDVRLLDGEDYNFFDMTCAFNASASLIVCVNRRHARADIFQSASKLMYRAIGHICVAGTHPPRAGSSHYLVPATSLYASAASSPARSRLIGADASKSDIQRLLEISLEHARSQVTAAELQSDLMAAHAMIEKKQLSRKTLLARITGDPYYQDEAEMRTYVVDSAASEEDKRSIDSSMRACISSIRAWDQKQGPGHIDVCVHLRSPQVTSDMPGALNLRLGRDFSAREIRTKLYDAIHTHSYDHDDRSLGEVLDDVNRGMIQLDTSVDAIVARAST